MQHLRALFEGWAIGASHLIGDLFDLAQPYLAGELGQFDGQLRFVSNQLFIDCHLSSESVLVLIREGREWDADLVNRAVMEGTVKYVYLIDGTPSEMQQKAHEFWEIIPDFRSIKRSERVKAILSEVKNPHDVQWAPYRDLLLSEEDISAMRHGMNKKERAEIEKRWSFSYIIQQYSRSDHPGLKLLAHLAHGYGMSSHLIHKDGDGVGMVWERHQRDPEQHEAVKVGHAARVVSDVCAFAKLRLFRLCFACGAESKWIHDIEERYQELEASLGEANAKFSAVAYPDT